VIGPPQRSSAGGLFFSSVQGMPVFVALQFPFTDSRDFVPPDTGRLTVPQWPDPAIDKEFVRAFGAVRRRQRGGLKNWPAEQVYCDAARALRFDGQLGCTRVLAGSGGAVKPYCAFRRLMVDGRATVRLEVGLGFRRPPPRPDVLDAEAFKSLIGIILNLPVKPPTGIDAGSPLPLAGVGNHIAASYLRATTSGEEKISHPQRWWIEPGLPQMVVEYRTDQGSVLLPENTQRVDKLDQDRVQLSYSRIRRRGSGVREVGVWFLGHEKTADRDFLRRLRMQLLRLHAEHEAIRSVFRHITRGRMDPDIDPQSRQGQSLQDFLEDAVTLLRHRTRYGLPQSEILAAAQRYDEIVAPGARATMMHSLRKIRPNLLRKVEDYTGWMEQHTGALSQVRTLILADTIGRLDMTDQSINVGGDMVGNINQIAARDIENSFNHVKSADADTALKEQLERLHQQVAAMARQLSEDKQKQLAKDLKEFSEQALSDEPRKRYLNVSKEGLIEAAETVQKIGKPVIQTVKTIVALLAL